MWLTRAGEVRGGGGEVNYDGDWRVAVDVGGVVVVDVVVVVVVGRVWCGVVWCGGGRDTGWAPVVTVHQPDRYSSALLSCVSWQQLHWTTTDTSSLVTSVNNNTGNTTNNHS